MCLLGDDKAHFLTNNCRINVLTIGRAFNLGEFFVTPLTYLHPLLPNVKTGKPAVILGPLLVHQKSDSAAFNYVASSKEDARRGLTFGTDGDKALVQTFTHN